MNLLGWSIDRDTVQPGAPIDLFTYWEMSQPVTPPLKIFIHLTAPDGKIVAQWDGLDVNVGSWSPAICLCSGIGLICLPICRRGRIAFRWARIIPIAAQRLKAEFDGRTIDSIVLGTLNGSMKTHQIARWEWILVVALLLIAFGLRTHDLLRVPPGLHNDEVAYAEITETVTQGRLAIFFPENIGNEGLAYYFAAPFMKVLGLNLLAIRLPAAFISMIAACLIWAFTRRLFGAIAAIAALASFAVIFWTVAFGRIGLHVVMLVPLATLAAYCLWRAQAATGRRVYAWWALSGAVYRRSDRHLYGCAHFAGDSRGFRRIHFARASRPNGSAGGSGIALALFVAALIAAPLFITLAQNPQEDQLGFFDIDRPLRELKQGNLQPVIETSLRTLGMFGFVGDPLPYYGIPDRPFLDPISFAVARRRFAHRVVALARSQICLRVHLVLHRARARHVEPTRAQLHAHACRADRAVHAHRDCGGGDHPALSAKNRGSRLRPVVCVQLDLDNSRLLHGVAVAAGHALLASIRLEGSGG